MTLNYLEKKLIFRSCFHDLLELGLSLITPPLGRQDLPQNASHAHELRVFQSGWWEQALFLALHACLLDAFPQIEVTSFHACEDRVLLSTPGGTPAVPQTSPSRLSSALPCKLQLPQSPQTFSSLSSAWQVTQALSGFHVLMQQPRNFVKAVNKLGQS